jgi:hypothetical protein
MVLFISNIILVLIGVLVPTNCLSNLLVFTLLLNYALWLCAISTSLISSLISSLTQSYSHVWTYS